MVQVRFSIPVISDYFRARAFLRNPLRYLGRSLFRIGISFGIFGISIGLGGIRGFIRVPFLAFFFGGRRRGGKRGGGNRGGGKRSGGGNTKSGGRNRSGEGGDSGGGSKQGSNRESGKETSSSRGGSETSSPRGERSDSSDSAQRQRATATSQGETHSRLRSERGRAALTRVGDALERLRGRLRKKLVQSRENEKDAKAKILEELEKKNSTRSRGTNKEKDPTSIGQKTRAKSDDGSIKKRSSKESTRNTSQRTQDKKSTPQKTPVLDQDKPKGKSENDPKSSTSAVSPKSPMGDSSSVSPNKSDGDQNRLEDAETNRPQVEFSPETSKTDFDINNPLPIGCRVLLEASAGTGKTFSLTSLVARYVAEKDLKIDQLLMVTFTKAAASEMRERTRSKLTEALFALMEGLGVESLSKDLQWAKQIIACDSDERSLRILRLRDAISNIDSATITTIHGFFQQALREVGLRSIDTALAEIAEADRSIARQIVRDDLVRQFSKGEVGLMNDLPEKNANDLEAQIHEVLTGLEANISAAVAPWKDDGTSAFMWSTYIRNIQQRIADVRRDSGNMSFDDLITGLRDLLKPGSNLREEIISDLQQRYRLVLIDEFQDTDDTQWNVFSQIFDSDYIKRSTASRGQDSSFLAMIMVGDPKQAIYRFRGADIAAYLKVSSDPDLIRYEMKRNFRSDRNLLVGLNRWFSGPEIHTGEPTGFKFGHPQIGYIQVDAAKGGEGGSLRIDESPESARALQFRWISTDTKPAPVVGKLRPRIAEDLADHVAILLNNGTLPDGKGGRRAVVPSDISILVRNHSDAEPIVEVLRSRNIAVVKSSIGSVLESEAVVQLQILLLAMAHPNDSRRVKAAGLTWFFNFEFEDLLDERQIVNLGLKMNYWSELLLEKGIVELFQTIKTDSNVILELSKSFDFERRMTDLEHIVELLHREVRGKRLPASSLLRHLIDMQHVEVVSDVSIRRIDTDAKAIQITTMHASKGLEYPIVLIPFPKGLPSKGWSTAKSPDVFTYGDQRFVDAAPLNDWSIDNLNSSTRNELALREIQGDDLRLMYVAFTRAKHQLVVWWAKSRGIEKGPLARLLFGNHDDIHEQTEVLDGANARSAFEKLKEKIGRDENGNYLMDVRELSLDSHEKIDLIAPSFSTSKVGIASVFPTNAQERFGWGRWSYSTLSKGVKSESVDVYRGGLDEDNEFECTPSGADTTEKLHPSGRLFEMPASSDFGTLVHEVLENVKFESPTLREDLFKTLGNRVSAVMREIDISILVDGLLDSLKTPLEPALPGFEFGNLHSRDRLAEMDFHFSLLRGPISTSEIARIAAKDTESLFSSYFAQLAQSMKERGNRKIDGILTGSIDVLFRVFEEEKATYYVADWKSNRLHRSGELVSESAYGFDSMKKAMEANHYPLQAIVYCVALHRFLESRLENYDIDNDLGGALYLFLRGMVGPTTPIIDGIRNGVFSWRPKSETIKEISNLLRGEE